MEHLRHAVSGSPIEEILDRRSHESETYTVAWERATNDAEAQ